MTESITKRFRTSDTIIRHLIESQAGTLSKAIIENVMNSIDAGATHVELDLSDTTFSVTDNGKGFQSEAEVDEVFAQFAFDHDSAHQVGTRTYGRFGLGRGQQWAFSSTVYRSRTLGMTIDIRKYGLEFQLTHFDEDFLGTRIDGTLYTPLTLGQLSSTENELKHMLKYVEIPVTLHGKRISIPPANEAWSLEDDDAYYRFTDGSQLHVYNMGVYVTGYSSYTTGVGGVLVTKSGRDLPLNMARNAVLQSQGELWPRLLAVCKAQARRNTTRERLSEMDYVTLIQDLFEGVGDYEQLRKVPLFVDHKGRGRDIQQFITTAMRHQSRVLMFDERNSRALTRAHNNRRALVLHPRTLSRLGENADMTRLQRVVHLLARHTAWEYNVKTLDFLTELPDELSTQHEDYELITSPGPETAAALRALGVISAELTNHIGTELSTEYHIKRVKFENTFKAGHSDHTSIWYASGQVIIEERELLAALRNVNTWTALIVQLASAAVQFHVDTTAVPSEETQLLCFKVLSAPTLPLMSWSVRSLGVLKQEITSRSLKGAHRLREGIDLLGRTFTTPDMTPAVASETVDAGDLRNLN